MAIRETITLNNKKYKRVLKDTERETEKYARKQKNAYRKTGRAAEKSSQKTRASFKKMSTAAKTWIAGGVITALYGLFRLFKKIGKSAVEFDANLTQSLAIMGDVSEATKKQMADVARSVSEDLNIAAEKAAKSYYYLASAGFDARQSIAALPAVAEFAKAGMFDMATATDLATDAQSALGLKSKDAQENLKNLTRVTDVLVKANQQANASVQQFSEAITNRAGAQLRAFNKPIEEGVAILADFADQGIKARRAGMFLSRVLRLTAEGASKNTEEFKKLGIIDADGNLANLADIVQILTERLDGLSDTQQTATLEQLGFTARVQDAIKPLLGTSDAIRGYQASLEAAGGATKEVADNQMKSLQERVGKLWKRFQNTFGPTFISIMDGAITSVEKLGSAFSDLSDDLTSSNLDNVIALLQKLGGQKELLIKLQTQQSINQAKDLRKKIEAQFKGIEIPFNIDKRSFIERYKNIIDAFGPQTQSSIGSASDFFQALNPVKDIRQAMQGARSVGFSGQTFNADNIEKYKQQLKVAQSYVSDLSGKISTMQSAGKEIPDDLTNQLELYQRQITAIQKGLALVDQYRASQKAITDLKKKQADQNKGIITDEQKIKQLKGGDSEPGGQADYIQKTADEYERFLKLMRLGQGSDPAEWAQTLNVKLKELGPTLEDLMSGGPIGEIINAHIKDAKDSVEKYNQQLTKLNNQKTSGAIGDAEYQKGVNEATKKYLSNLKAIYNLIKGKLTPAQQEMFKDLFGNFKDADKDAKKFKLKLDDIADTVDAIVNVGDAFGSIGENAKDSLRGISDVLRGIQNIQEAAEAAEGGDSLVNLFSSAAGIATGVGAAVGIAGGLASIIGGMGAQDAKSADEVRKLRTDMVSLKNEIERNTQALQKEAIIGSDISQGMIDAGRDAISGIKDTLKNSAFWQQWKNSEPGGGLFGLGDHKQRTDERLNNFIDNNLADFFDQIANSGIDQLSGYDLQQFKDLAYSIGGQNLNGKELQEAFDAFINGSDDFVGVNEILKETQDSLGKFGDSLAGVSKRLELSDTLGLDKQESFNTYLEKIIGLVGSDNKLTSLLGDIENADSKEERKDLAKQIWDAYKNDKSILGQELTESDLEQIINTIIGRDNATGSASSDYSRSTQVANSITSVEANEVLFFLERIEQWTRDSAAALGSQTALNVNASPIEAARQYSRQNPLAVEIVGMDNSSLSSKIKDVYGPRSPNEGGKLITGDITIPSPITDEDIDGLMLKLGTKLKQEVRGR